MFRSRSFLALVAAATIAALAVAGCSDEKGDTVINTSSSNEQTGITVSGRGEVVVSPDTGFFEGGVSVTAKTVAEARESAAKAAEAFISSVKGNGVDAKDIQTSGFAIYPQYVYPPNGGQPSITGYQVTNTVSVKVRKLDTFSKVLDDAIVVGGDAVVVSGIRFGIEDDTKAASEARALAVANAKMKADELAKAAGAQVGDVLSIAEVQQQAEVYPVAAPRTGAAGFAYDTGTPIEAGTNKVAVNVTIRWSIRQK